jgi:diacylglycerol kinase family enzyme
VKNVAVVAHAGKTIGGGLEELRRELRGAGVEDPYWSEVPKSKYAPERVERALGEGAELVFVWGGDGMVQRCVDVMAGSGATMAIVPAGTANLFASNLGIPQDIAAAVEIGLGGRTRTLDVGKLNGERFAVMAGAGIDARMIKDADGNLKERFGRLAYIWTASKNLRTEPFEATVEVNDELWYQGTASCILLGNVGVTNAEGLGQWARTVARTAVGSTAKSPFVQVTKAKKVTASFDRKVPYELDGGDRKKTRRLRIKVHHEALTVCVPAVTD